MNVESMIPTARLLLNPESIRLLEGAWHRLDLDKDGFLTANDFRTPAGMVDALWSKFLPADTDLDSRVSSQEFEVYFLRHALQALAARTSPHGLTELQALVSSVEAMNRDVQTSLAGLATEMRAKGAAGW